MSNFTCEHCGTDILEGKGGRYVTECAHYPIEKIKPLLYHAEMALWDTGKCRCPQCGKYRKREDIPDQPTSADIEYKDMVVHVHLEPACKWCLE